MATQRADYVITAYVYFSAAFFNLRETQAALLAAPLKYISMDRSFRFQLAVVPAVRMHATSSSHAVNPGPIVAFDVLASFKSISLSQ